MGKFMKGDIVVLNFPFSDLSGIKRRPALVISDLDGNDIILCQITSSSKTDKYSVKIEANDFIDGKLSVESVIRPNKIFTADKGIILYTACKINNEKTDMVIKSIINTINASMDRRVHELQQNLFGGLHDFHTQRTGVLIDVLRQKLGDEVLEILQTKGVDKYGLYRWHLEMLIDVIEILKEKYGEQVFEIICEKQLHDRYEQGKTIAEDLGKNELDDYIEFTTGGDKEKIISRTDKEVLIKSTGCLAGKVAYDINKADLIYKLHCATDPTFLKGFNENLCCEVIQTLMDGHDCCIHKIYYKDK